MRVHFILKYASQDILNIRSKATLFSDMHYFTVYFPIITISSDPLSKEQVRQYGTTVLALSDARLSKQKRATQRHSFCIFKSRYNRKWTHCLSTQTTTGNYLLLYCMYVCLEQVCVWEREMYVCIMREGKKTPRCIWCNYTFDYLIE